MKRWRVSRLARVAVLSVFVVMSIPFSGIAVAEETRPLVDPILQTSATFDLKSPPVNCPEDQWLKIETPGPTGDGPETYTVSKSVPRCDSSGEATVTVTIEIYGSNRNMVSFEIEGGRTGAVYVKGGAGPQGLHGNLYWYADGGYPDGVTEDWDLETPSGLGISHVDFCLCADAAVQKNWEFTAPDAFAGEGYDYKAYYSEVDPADAAFDPAADWVEVALSDDNGVYTGTTYHEDDTTIWWKWVVHDGMDVVFETGVYGPETLMLDGSPYTNDFQLCLKAWLWNTPELLGLLFDQIELSAFYALEDPALAENGVAWTEVVLDEDNGSFYAETLFECGTEIWYYFEVAGYSMGTRYYHNITPVLSEVIAGSATFENVFVEPRTLKTFELTACVEPAGGTYYAAWGLTNEGPWHVVELEPVPGEECVYSGEVELFEGMEIYWKFYDEAWSTVVLGPETLEGAEMVNRWERTGVTRTIGYWQTHPCMTELVFESIGGEIDICWTTLESIEEVMAVLNYPQMSGAPRLSNWHRAVLQTSRQLVAATLNEGLGSTMPMYNGMSAYDAFCEAIADGDIETVRAIGELLDEFNNSGTEEWLPEWTWECWVAADPMTARALGADGWHAVRSDLP